MDVVAVGLVPDEVLVLCGRPHGTPSTWWTPALARRTPASAARLVRETAAALTAEGFLDADGVPTGALGVVAEIVQSATVAVLVEVERAGEQPVRRSLLAAETCALLDAQDADAGMHELTVVSAGAAAALLADLLTVAPPADGALGAVAGRRSVTGLADLVPVARRHTTIRVVRVAAGDDGAGHLLTVLGTARGALACWAVADGLLEVQVLHGEDDVVSLALGLLGASRVVDGVEVPA